MPNKHGEFIWYELLTDDSNAAIQFYSKLLGWDVANSGHPEIDYSILSIRDETGARREVGGVMQLTEQMRQGGAKPIWLGYIGVDNVDQTVANVVADGGTVHMPPTDTPEVG